MASVSLKNIRKSYDGKNDVLAGIDLDIEHGEFVALVGTVRLRQDYSAAHVVRPGIRHRRHADDRRP
jgi:hypothetical protein